jgi:GcrA cell cycle regulator
MLWTAEAVEDLKRLAHEGKSASHIAVALGVGSRNAVIGKASRIGIKLNGGGRRSVRGKTPARAGRSQGATARFTRPNPGDHGADAALGRDPGILRSQPGARGEKEAAWMLGEAEIGDMRRVRFEEIHEFACRWPIGDPKSGDFAYCGLNPAEGQSYCAGHCRMAYRPPKASARRNPAERQGLPPLANPWRPF